MPEQRAAMSAESRRAVPLDAAGGPNWRASAKTHRGVRALRSADASRRSRRWARRWCRTRAAAAAAQPAPRLRHRGCTSSSRRCGRSACTRTTSRASASRGRVPADAGAVCGGVALRRQGVHADLGAARDLWRRPRARRRAAAARCGGGCRRRAGTPTRCGGGAIARQSALLAELRAAIEARLRAQRPPRDVVFELFRFDFLVDDRARPVLTEVNISPNMVGRVPEDAAAAQRLAARHAAPRPRRLDAASARRRRARRRRRRRRARSRRRAPRAAAAASTPRRARSSAGGGRGGARRLAPHLADGRRRRRGGGVGRRRRGATPSCAACCAEGHRFSLGQRTRLLSSSAFVSSAPSSATSAGFRRARPSANAPPAAVNEVAEQAAVDAVEHRHRDDDAASNGSTSAEQRLF